MLLIQYLHFFSLLVYSYMAGYIIYKDSKSLLNISCSILITSFAIWNIVDVFGTDSNISATTAILFQNISSVGWIGFSSIFLCFALAFSRRDWLLRKFWFIIPILLLPAVLIYAQWTNRMTTNPSLGNFGWEFHWTDSFWSYLFYAYYISFTLITIFIVYKHGRNSAKKDEKNQARIIVITVIISLVGGSITDVILPVFHIQAVPQIGNVILSVFSGGMIYAIVKYKFLMITPAYAAENIVSTMGELMILSNQEGRILKINDSVINSLSYDQNGLIGKPIEVLFRPNDSNTLSLEKIANFESLKNQESIFLTRDGNDLPVIFSYSPLRDKSGDMIGHVIIARDITDRKLAEEVLKKNEQIKTELLEKLNDAQTIAMIGSWEWNLVTDEVWWSDETYRIFGVTPENFTPSFTAILKFIHADYTELYENAFDFSLRTGARLNIVIKIVTHDGICKHCNGMGKIISDEMGGQLRFIGTVMDITDRKLQEDAIQNLNETLELRVKERTAELNALNCELEAFSYTISHDLRAPLRSINGFTQILMEDYSSSLDEEGRSLCKTITNNSQKMGQMVDDLLSFSQLGRKELQRSEISMKNLVITTYNEIVEIDGKEKIMIEIGDLCNASADEAMIKHVWMNLLSNAIKYSSKREFSEISVTCKNDGRMATYCVRDNGVGFDKAYANKLFGVFQRLHSKQEFEGNGVGLAIVQRIIQRHGGEVWAESEVDKGAAFFFSLPVSLP